MFCVLSRETSDTLISSSSFLMPKTHGVENRRRFSSEPLNLNRELLERVSCERRLRFTTPIIDVFCSEVNFRKAHDRVTWFSPLSFVCCNTHSFIRQVAADIKVKENRNT